jgi:hypothetical protein
VTAPHPHPECRFCEEHHDEVRTKSECNLTRARTTAGRWLIIEQQASTARAALKVIERELGALDVLDNDSVLPDELAQARAAYEATVSNLLNLDAYTALIIRQTGQESELANAVVRKERAVAMAKAEAMQTASECGACRREDVPIVGAVTKGSGSVVALCEPCMQSATAEATRG